MILRINFRKNCDDIHSLELQTKEEISNKNFQKAPT